MKRNLLILVAILGLQAQGVAQSKQNESAASQLRAGGGYFGESFTHPGFVLEFEYEKVYSPVFSLPLRANLGYHVNKDYHTFFLDVHKRLRKLFRSGVFLEQRVGAGVVAKSCRADMW